MSRAVRTLAQGIYFGEGPRWHEGRLWLSDFYASRVCSVSLAGDLQAELELEGRPSGLGWLPDGSLLVVRMELRQVWRRWPDGRFERHADLTGHSAFLCNDMVVDGQGRAYVGNFGFDLDAELRARGPESVIGDHPTTVLALVQPDGTVSDAAPGEKFSFPNGMVITPDGGTLIVGETLGGRLTAFDIADDGTLTNRREWAPTWPRVPDGICLDASGAVWIANPLAPECALIAPGGEVLAVIETGLPCYACMLGGPEGKHLFMLVAPSSDAHEAAKAPLGKVLVAEVDVGRAGLP
ncbi:SMP-30/gluconolactonase/LRE family protein [Novosphingobium sp.]|uniref:SMP-30/gluconolactonase/LRE family protein n=1 Tax=Novosphingobium sp. TaxID=1874826 RepID=UPI0022C9384C|nr:SMP-30/gluconolactonase/LRE family protein [Novosphingobium sp.]MCZ8018623.1 SMP-30/gluconolactonase/LRE family protein [Novosphingobium sp.]MCZ8036084.1 SMP-30/gluconolactonase/LRE family protein [Novosphingobium sp.]MCZ8050372.1 SMP-30/gluconolactonase/LRE family protein [Novosphingobium sp.]MCZ8060962.1 SMP-30/gluconolactonase/LRE family protein [Novosphingobium sp.]MCZ8233208.1 SMP-30/gluconolactonase/LRE family protein [Novosphingobium sp.]